MIQKFNFQRIPRDNQVIDIFRGSSEPKRRRDMDKVTTVAEWKVVQRLYPNTTKVVAIRDTDTEAFEVFRAAFQAWRGAPGSANYSEALEWATYDDTDLTGDYVNESESLPYTLDTFGRIPRDAFGEYDND